MARKFPRVPRQERACIPAQNRKCATTHILCSGRAGSETMSGRSGQPRRRRARRLAKAFPVARADSRSSRCIVPGRSRSEAWKMRPTATLADRRARPAVKRPSTRPSQRVERSCRSNLPKPRPCRCRSGQPAPNVNDNKSPSRDDCGCAQLGHCEEFPTRRSPINEWALGPAPWNSEYKLTRAHAGEYFRAAKPEPRIDSLKLKALHSS